MRAEVAGVTAPPVTDRCPGALSLHAAQDGNLARIRVPGGILDARALAALARGARLGSGLADLTSRANLQIRGLGPGAGTDLTVLLRSAGLLPSPAHDRARNILASPLAGRHPAAVADTDAAVRALDAALCGDPALAALPGRFLFAVDDGSGIALEPRADVTLLARDEATFDLAIGGHVAASALPVPEAAGLAAAVARAFQDARALSSDRAWRLHELAGGARAVAGALGLPLAAPVRAGIGTADVGRLRQRDGRWAITGLVALGRLDASVLDGLSRLATGAAAHVRIGARRTLTVVDVRERDVRAVASGLERLGLVLDAGSGWVALTACAGTDGCPRALVDVRAAAHRRARARAAAAPPEHWSACERRCGERAEQPVTVAAVPGGLLVRRPGHAAVAADVDAALAVLA